jgi:hypothetical protein
MPDPRGAVPRRPVHWGDHRPGDLSLGDHAINPYGPLVLVGAEFAGEGRAEPVEFARRGVDESDRLVTVCDVGVPSALCRAYQPSRASPAAARFARASSRRSRSGGKIAAEAVEADRSGLSSYRLRTSKATTRRKRT